MPLELVPTDVVCPFARSTMILRRNAARRYLVVSISNPAAVWRLWFQQQFGAVGFNVPEGQDCLTLHRAVYGELVLSDWYIFTDLTITVTVLDAWDS